MTEEMDRDKEIFTALLELVEAGAIAEAIKIIKKEIERLDNLDRFMRSDF